MSKPFVEVPVDLAEEVLHALKETATSLRNADLAQFCRVLENGLAAKRAEKREDILWMPWELKGDCAVILRGNSKISFPNKPLRDFFCSAPQMATILEKMLDPTHVFNVDDARELLKQAWWL